MSLPALQLPSQNLDKQLAAVPLEKFSFAVTTLGTGSHQWVHENRADKLFLAFRCEDATENSLIMSVTVGIQILERLDVKKLKAMVEDFEIQRQNMRVDDHPEPPVHVMVRFPCIALRYLTSLTLRRRIQMRFKNKADYQKVVEILEALKFPLNYAGTKECPAAPLRALKPYLQSLTQNPALSSASYQQSVSNVGKHWGTRTSSIIDHSSNDLLAPILTEEFPSFKQSHTVSSDSSACQFDSSRISDTTSAMPFGEPHVRPSSVPENGRHIFASQSKSMVRPPLLFIPELESDRMSPPDLSQHQERHLLFTKNRAMSEAFGSSLTRFDISKQDKSTSLIPRFLRPISAPVPPNPENSSQWAPPRRELPFPKARNLTKSLTRPVDLLVASEPQVRSIEQEVVEDNKGDTRGDTRLALPRTLKEAGQRQTDLASLTPQRNMPNSSTEDSLENDGRDGRLQILAEQKEEISPLAARSAAIGRPSTAPGLRSKQLAPTTRKRGRVTGPNSVKVNKQARKMVDKETQTQTCSGYDHTTSLAATACTEQSLSSATDEAVQPPKIFMDEVENFVSRHKHRPQSSELWQRPGYSEASPEERQEIIDEFICENLDNEDFLALCEDTGNAWRRIGLEF